MATEPGLNIMTLYSTDSFAAATKLVQFGPFTNDITIRRFIEGAEANASSGTTALNIDDAGTAGTGSTAIADKSATEVTVAGAVTTPTATNAANGYKLAAGHCLKVSIVVATATITGYTIAMEWVEGIG